MQDLYLGREGTYKRLITEDGSETLFAQHYGEACHSLAGAIAETKQNYLEGCQLKQRHHHYESFFILEIGFGVGHGYFETCKLWRELKTPIPLKYVAVELDPFLVKHAFGRELEATAFAGVEAFREVDKGVDLLILIGNARQTLLSCQTLLQGKFHAIYQDPFSPKRNPDLWTTEWFELLRNLSHPEVILSTYSASVCARKSMLEAGWKIHDGPAFGRKRLTTWAALQGETRPEIVNYLKRSPIAPMTDATIEAQHLVQ